MSERVNFDDHTNHYDQLLQEQTGFFTKNDAYFAHYKVKLAKQNIQRPVKRILEYGCGTGRNIPFLIDAFPSAVVDGSDISEASLEVARQSVPKGYFFTEDAATQITEPYDLIFVAGVFHHIPPAERTATVETLKKRLTQNGELIIFEHNPYNPVTRKIVSNCPYDADAVLLAPHELRALLSANGFNVKSSGYCLFVPPRLTILAWLEDYLPWLPLGGQYFVYASIKQA
jgi:SAM-dependent methyltransferase